MKKTSTLVELLRERKERHGDALLYRFLKSGDVDGDRDEWSFSALDARARGISRRLQQSLQPGDRALLLFPPGLDFIAAFFGCLYARVIAVPAYPPDLARMERTLPRLRGIIDDSQSRVALTIEGLAGMAAQLTAGVPFLRKIEWIATDRLFAGDEERNDALDVGAADIAFLQYTSGSTSDPKGVSISHANIIACESQIAEVFQCHENDTGVGWLPLYHDMGLIGNVLQPLYSGFPMTLFSPLDFLARPTRWISAVSHYQATISGGPDFAYYLCSRRIADAELSTLKLGNWRVAFNGAEPINAATLEAFARRMAPAGFRRSAFVPCYGLAEATLLVTGAPPRDQPLVREVPRADLGQGTEDGVATLVSSGRTPAGLHVRIVDPVQRTPCEEGAVGEVWVRGPNVSSGYWGQSETLNRETFRARLAEDDGASDPMTYLRTGDLGVQWDGELFVTGRAKDLIIVRGRNFYPQDVERCAERAVAELRPGCSAAFGGPDGTSTIVAEVRPNTSDERFELAARELRDAVADDLGLMLSQVVFVRARAVPKTSSGKIQRRKCAAMLASGELPVVATVQLSPVEVHGDAQRAPNAKACPEAEPSPPVALAGLVDRVRGVIAATTGIDTQRIPPGASASSLGLDSVMMMNVQAAIEADMGVKLPDFSVWYDTTPVQLASLVESAQPAQRTPARRRPRLGRNEPRPLSPGQKRLWVLDRIAPGTSLYNLAFGWRIRGEFDPSAMNDALRALERRHPILALRLGSSGGEPFAFIGDGIADMEIVLADQEPVESVITRWAEQPFVLEGGPLSRAAWVRCTDDEGIFVIAQHHAIGDGWSTQRLAADLLAAYEGTALPNEETTSFEDYVAALAQEDAARVSARQYWTNQLTGMSELELPTKSPGAVTAWQGRTLAFDVPAAVWTGLRERTGLTPFVAIVAAFALVLHRYGGSRDFGVGTVLANRGNPEHRDVVGFLANTVVLRCKPDPTQSIASWLRAIEGTVTAATRHGQLPFSELLATVARTVGGDQNPLFRAAVIHEGFAAPVQHRRGASFEPYLLAPDGSVPGTAKFDVSVLACTQVDGGVRLGIEYRTALFEDAFIARMREHLEQALLAFAGDTARTLAEVPLLTAQETRVLEQWERGGERPFPMDVTVHDLVEAQTVRSPEDVAVVFEDESLTYAELDSWAQKIAGALVARGVGPGDRVALCVRRSMALVPAMLGILKAGAAYVPIDPEYPSERRRYVLDDCGAVAIVGDGSTLGALRQESLPKVDAARVRESATMAASPSDAVREGLMYMIYTSGSTGKPKGVRVPHRCVVGFLDAMDERLGVPKEPSKSAWLAISSVSFDISVLEIFWPLVHGMTVVIQGELGFGRSQSPPVRANPELPAPDFGLFYFAAEEDDRPGPERYRLLLEGAKFGDRNGFSSVWMPERHFHAFGGLYPNPSVTAAAVAAVTERIALRAGSVVLPLHHPVRVAEEWSVVDNLSGGRVGLSIASGWHANDFVFAPERYEQRREVLSSSLDLLLRLWRGEEVSFPNGRGEPTPVRLRPRPVQAELPIWFTAAGTPQTFEAAGTMGAGLLTHLLGQTWEQLGENLRRFREARAAAGHVGPGRVVLMLHTFVAEDEDFVRAEIAAPFRSYLKSSSDLLRGLATSLGLGGAGALRPEDLDVLVEHAFKRYVETAGLFGTPASCRDRIHELSELGVSEIGCLIDFGIASPTVLENLGALADLRRKCATRLTFSIPEQVTRRRITHLQCTPSLAQMLAFDDEALDALANVEHVLLGGEAMPTSLASRILARRSELGVDGALVNMYGPTETTIWSTTHRVDTVEGSIPIGRPIVNTRTYVLDERRGRCPVGVPGELFIAGAGVVEGYHHRAELDAERFLPDPFHPSDRMYRTGDRVVWREDGTLGYLGRTDFQVKLRGHRIELGEIEAALEGLPTVERAVARVCGLAEEQRLVAYVVLEPGLERGTEGVEADLRASLESTLPPALIPSAFVFLPELPRTPNGKVDRRALPEPGQPREPTSAVALTPPRNDLERRVASIWGDVLGKSEVGRDQSFFDLGGHSLLMARVHARLKSELDVDLPLVRLFQYPTIATLVAHLEQSSGAVGTTATIARGANREREALRRMGQRSRTTTV